MSDFISNLTYLRKKIGWEPPLFFILATGTLTFCKEIPEERLKIGTSFVAAGLFAVGLLITLLKIVSVFFTQRPARGLIDGLAAGLLSGLIGGYFGYGFHETWQAGAYKSLPYLSPVYLRVFYCIVFATPIGAVLGTLCDLIHSDRQIPWRPYAGALLSAFFTLLIAVGGGVFLFAPLVEDPGITVGDIQLLFEIFLLFFSFIVTFSFGWSLIRFFARIPLILLCILITRIFTYFVNSWDPNEIVPLYKYFFYFIKPESPLPLAGTVIFFMGWTVFCYFIFYKDTRGSLWLEKSAAKIFGSIS